MSKHLHMCVFIKKYLESGIFFPDWYKEMRPTRKCGIIFQHNHSGCSAVNELTLARRHCFTFAAPLELLWHSPGLVVTTEWCYFNWHVSCRCIKRCLFVLNKVCWAIKMRDVMMLCCKGLWTEATLFLEESPLTSSCCWCWWGCITAILHPYMMQQCAGTNRHCGIPAGLPKRMQCGGEQPPGSSLVSFMWLHNSGNHYKSPFAHFLNGACWEAI